MIRWQGPDPRSWPGRTVGSLAFVALTVAAAFRHLWLPFVGLRVVNWLLAFFCGYLYRQRLIDQDRDPRFPLFKIEYRDQA